MSPVQWKNSFYVALLLFELWTVASSNTMQDPITMTSDGWRPIVGSRREPPGFGTDSRIPQFKKPNKNKNVEIENFKSENPITITTAEPEQLESSTKPLNNLNAGPSYAQNYGNKIAPHSKYSPPKYQTLPPSAVSLGRPSQYGFRKHSIPAKPAKVMSHLGQVPKRMPPPRGPSGAHSNRNEVFIHPSGSITFPFTKPGPSNVRPRETQGLGLFGSQNHFTVNQPNSHIEINRFPSANENVFEQYKSPGISFLVPKLKLGQGDEYSRNLVPPPFRNLAAEKEKLKNSKFPVFKDNTASVSEPVYEIHESFGVQTPQVQENLIQVPVNYNHNFSLHQQAKNHLVDVQVTKENFKVFHSTSQNRFKPSGPDYVDFDYHNVPTSGQPPKLQTYEVTEGKWQDNPNPYTFNYIKPQDSIQNIKAVRPQSAATQITNEPVVELNLPPFLPTPYIPDPIYPTSATQSEASTVFSQVSQKMNKYKNAALNNNPLFFDIKEVSTHYPILGKPSFIDYDQTTNPVKENEIVNEVTTPREEMTTKKRRRRPQPSRPVSTTTTTTTTPTTTTEEPPTTEIYQPIKSQEDIAPETEKPLPKRIRQRPNRYKLLSGSGSINQESPLRYRTTTPVTEYEESNEEKRTRGRNRYRQRGSGNKDSSELQKPVHRKRTRPTTTEMPFNQKIEKGNVEQPKTVGHDSRYSQNIGIETTTKHQRIIDYDENSMSDENRNEDVYESTPNANFLEDIGFKSIRTTISPDGTTLINNEIEFSTPSSQLQNNQESAIETTLATTIPTPTTTETRSTVRHNRIKTRPTSFKTSNRPRFSVKDYRQRLNQYPTSSTPPSTTDILKTTSEVPRIRFPVRLRTRPTHYSTTTPSPPPEETTTEILLRRRFKPKDPRHTIATESTNIIPETNVKSVNTRLRPFDRQKINTEIATKSTVEEDSKAKASIKPSLYSNRRRPSIGIRKLNKTEEAVTKEKEVVEISDEEKDDAELTTEYQSVKISTTEISPMTTIDINVDDYSQRVSDLTSSFKEYETPGLFKNVAPISRRVPNYFTLSTEDPILPIEAFFPGINENKDKET